MISLKPVIPFGILYLILCGNLQSQSIFLDTSNLSTVANYNYTHGFGVAPISSYNPDAAFEKACELALEELNSNQFMSVYIEQFQTGANAFYTFPELSVRDTAFIYNDNVVKADSFKIANHAYCISVDKNSVSFPLSMPSLEELKVSPVKKDGIWYAMGIEKASKYNPYRAWILSKNDALKELTKTITTTVQSSMIESNFSFAEFTYVKSYVIFKNVVVTSRLISPENEFVTIIAAKETELVQVE